MPRRARARSGPGPAFGLLPGLLIGLLLALSACAPRPAPPPPPPPPQETPAEPRDLLDLPQDVAAYFAPEALDAPFLTPEVQQREAIRLRELHFAPWHRTAPAFSRAAALWGLETLKAGRHYAENYRPLGPEFAQQMEAFIRPETYPNTLRPAVATANTSLRVLPTERPGFLKPELPGEGYPFDYWQNSGLLAGAPLLVTQLSADGAWALVEGRVAGGWVRVADIAFVDTAFMDQWEALPLAAVIRENTPVRGRPDGTGEGGSVFLFSGRIGTLLPLAGRENGGLLALAPGRGADGRAVSMPAALPDAEAQPLPIAPTPRNYARLAAQLMGQPYGWGGLLGNRDCSALLLDLYAPFGIFLPRNSRQQSRQGEWTPFTGLSPKEKEALLLARGAPLLTLLHKPGHILLYLGQMNGRAVVLHDVWGLRTKDLAGKEGRFVLGRVVITTLEPGADIPDVARSGTLLGTLDGMTRIAPDKDPAAAAAAASRGRGAGSWR